jgi:hypothetical protein
MTPDEQRQDEERLRAAGWTLDLDGLWRKPGPHDGTEPMGFGAAVRAAVMAATRIVYCPECRRVASVPEWCSRPICVHAWDGCTPEVWDGDDCGPDEGPRRIEDSPNEAWRTPGPKTWAEMVAFALDDTQQGGELV